MERARKVRAMNEPVSFVVFEAATTRLDRIIKRLAIVLALAVVLLFASNALWLWAWMQYDYTSEEIVYQQDGKGTNIIGHENEVLNTYGPEGDY